VTKDFYLSKRGTVWYVRFRSGDKILTARSSGQTNKTAAEKWARAHCVAAGDSLMSLGDWSAPFFGDNCPHVSRLVAEGKSYSDRPKAMNRKYLVRLKADPVMRISLSDLSRAHMLELRDRVMAKYGKSRTTQLMMQAIATVVREAMFRGMIQHDPFAGVGKVAYEEKERLALSDEQLKVVLDPKKYENPLHWEATLCAALTGMRAGEVRALQWGDISDGVIRITRAAILYHSGTKAPKWGKVRVCPYPEELSKVLEPRRGKPGEWVFGTKGALGYAHWAKAVKDNGATIHQLRHTLNSRLLSSGVPPAVIRGAFGWSDSKVQDGYTHASSFDYAPQSAAIDSMYMSLKEAPDEAEGD